jgi:hypothetical protein
MGFPVIKRRAELQYHHSEPPPTRRGGAPRVSASGVGGGFFFLIRVRFQRRIASKTPERRTDEACHRVTCAKVPRRESSESDVSRIPAFRLSDKKAARTFVSVPRCAAPTTGLRFWSSHSSLPSPPPLPNASANKDCRRTRRILRW